MREIIQDLKRQVVGEDAWLQKKVDPTRRFLENEQYLRKNFPELQAGGRTFLDIGPGPGYTMSVARRWGNRVLGVDAISGFGGMGDGYLGYSVLNHIELELNVCYCGWDFLNEFVEDESVDCLNMRGSFEQCMSGVMVGVPHHEHHKSDALAWDIERARIQYMKLAILSQDALKHRGRVVIHANGSANHADIKSVFVSTMSQYGGIQGCWVEDKLYYGTKLS